MHSVVLKSFPLLIPVMRYKFWDASQILKRWMQQDSEEDEGIGID